MMPALKEEGSQDSLPDSISPEGARVAQAYLQAGCDVNVASQILGVEPHEVSRIIQERVVDNFITQVISDSSLRHMDAITEKMDEIILKKMNEMDELDMGSSKDIADLLQMLHKMQVDKTRIIADKIKKNEKIQQGNTNVQVNNFDSSNYGRLMENLIKGGGN